MHFKKIILVNNSTGTVKFRASGNFPYPTITYCELDDPRGTAVFENSVNQFKPHVIQAFVFLLVQH